MELRAAKNERVLVTTLTKKMAEDLTDYLAGAGIRVRYMHSDIGAIERMEIVRDLRKGEFDVLVGINLLREGPVSYTHLDVYKRQLLHGAFGAQLGSDFQTRSTAVGLSLSPARFGVQDCAYSLRLRFFHVSHSVANWWANGNVQFPQKTCCFFRKTCLSLIQGQSALIAFASRCV